jgi:MoxR-like ATPase
MTRAAQGVPVVTMAAHESPSEASRSPFQRADEERRTLLLEAAVFEVRKAIVGQDRLVERVLVSLLARGHCLLEGVPGLAKTLTVETFAKVMGGDYSRVQFTPDLLPSDIVGTRIYRSSQEKFEVELGPIFANFVLADEVNRAPAKVQSALLEVMSEHQVTLAGRSYPVPDPFLVLATQNPLESAGVYPLPEAQQDRFLFKLLIHHPDYEDELEIVRRMMGRPPEVGQVLGREDVVSLQRATDLVHVDSRVSDYAVRIVMATRQPDRFGLPDLGRAIAVGVSPRASLGLVRGARALAILRGRSYVVPRDVTDIAPDVLRHRLLLTYEAMSDGLHVDHVIDALLHGVELPDLQPAQRPAQASG